MVEVHRQKRQIAGQMEQTRKLLAGAFDKDPIKQQYCIFYVDHLLVSGRTVLPASAEDSA
jgi:hypothetical protein